MEIDSVVWNFLPRMIHCDMGGICRECGAWIPNEWADALEYYKKHVEWHKRVRENNWST